MNRKPSAKPPPLDQNSTVSPHPTAPQEPPRKDPEYNLVIAGRVLTRIATTPQSLIKICEAPDMPDLATLFGWLRAWPEFREQYEQAMRTRADLLMEETLDLVDDLSQDVIVTADGKIVFNRVAIQRCKLRIEHRKWIASKLLPEKYGNQPKVKASAPRAEPRSEETPPTKNEAPSTKNSTVPISTPHPTPAPPPISDPTTKNEAPSTKNEAPSTKNEAPRTPPSPLPPGIWMPPPVTYPKRWSDVLPVPPRRQESTMNKACA